MRKVRDAAPHLVTSLVTAPRSGGRLADDRIYDVRQVGRAHRAQQPEHRSPTLSTRCTTVSTLAGVPLSTFWVPPEYQRGPRRGGRQHVRLSHNRWRCWDRCRAHSINCSLTLPPATIAIYFILRETRRRYFILNVNLLFIHTAAAAAHYTM